MQRTFSLIAKAIKFVFRLIIFKFQNYYTWVKFYINNVQFENFLTNGIPFIMVSKSGRCKFGKNLKLNNGLKGNPIGRPQPCVFFVGYNATISIGDNVGISSAAFVAHKSISIGDHVKIGGGVCIYDTDFHSLNSESRLDSKLDSQDVSSAPVIIKNNAFIGAHSTILKGVTIGKSAIIGACSVVTKSVPDNEIWAGNPAKFIRKIL